MKDVVNFKPWVYKKDVCVTVEETYPKGTPPIPLGWEVVDFRPPSAGENWLSEYSGDEIQASYNYASDTPRIILKRKELSFDVGDVYENKGVFYKVVETGGTGENEWVDYHYLCSTGIIAAFCESASVLRKEWVGFRRAKRGEWIAAVIEKCCSFNSCGTGGAA